MAQEMGQGTGLGRPDPTGAKTSGSGSGDPYLSPGEAFTLTRNAALGFSGEAGPIDRVQDAVQNFISRYVYPLTGRGYPPEHIIYNRIISEHGRGPVLRGASSAAKRAANRFAREHPNATPQQIQDAANRAYQNYGNPRDGGRQTRSSLAPLQAQAVARLTPSQKRASGLFFAKGKKVSTKAVATRAFQNLIAGKTLSRNQNTLLGYALKGMTPGQRRQLTTQLAVVKSGTTSTHVRESFGKAIGNAYRVANQVTKNARSATQIQKIAAARPTKVYRTTSGKTRTVTQVLKGAVLYAKTGKTLRPTHMAMLKTLNVNQLKRLGIPNAGRVAQQLARR